MGTNYYARYSPCKECGRCSIEKHIGKSSIGWKFLFDGSDGISSWEEWKKELSREDVQIWDEYNEKVELSYLEELVESKQQDPRNKAHYDSRYNRQDSRGYDFGLSSFS